MLNVYLNVFKYSLQMRLILAFNCSDVRVERSWVTGSWVEGHDRFSLLIKKKNHLEQIFKVSTTFPAEISAACKRWSDSPEKRIRPSQNQQRGGEGSRSAEGAVSAALWSGASHFPSLSFLVREIELTLRPTPAQDSSSVPCEDKEPLLFSWCCFIIFTWFLLPYPFPLATVLGSKDSMLLLPFISKSFPCGSSTKHQPINPSMAKTRFY